MTPTQILRVLSTIREYDVRALLMGGQACVLYGAAEYSRDLDLAVLATPESLPPLRSALEDLVAAKKTQRDKDWPMIRRLVDAAHVAALAGGDVESALAAEQFEAMAADRAYWLPLRRELEALRHQAGPRSVTY